MTKPAPQIIPFAQRESRPLYTLSQAFSFCEDLARSHYENFPVASLAVPKKLRPYIASVYAFARLADDFADEAFFEGQRLERLAEWEAQLKMLPTFEAVHPVFVALQETIRLFQIPVSLFSDLLTAFRMDVNVKRYESFDQVLAYCRYSANPVGRIVLYIMGYPAPRLMEYSDSICTALQLTNFWQDVAIDLAKDRIYLPQEDLRHFGYAESDLQKKLYSENFRRLMIFEIERTRALFARGRPLLGIIPGRFGLELKLTWLGGMTILDKISKVGMDVFNRRPQLGKKEALKILFKGLVLKNRTTPS